MVYKEGAKGGDNKAHFKFSQITIAIFFDIKIKGDILMSGVHIVENTNTEKNTNISRTTASTPPQ